MTASRRAGAILRATLSLLVFLLLLVGVPIALFYLAGSPIPTTVPTGERVKELLTQQDDGTLFIGALRLIAWAAWATFAASCLAELAGSLRGRQAPSLPALGAPQRLAGYLIASIALGFTATSANATPTPPTDAFSSASTSTLTVGPQHSTPPAHPKPTQPKPTPPKTAHQLNQHEKIHTVKPGENLWQIADRELGDGDRYMEIFNASKGLKQPAGKPALTHPREIQPGQRLVIPPADAKPVQPAPTPPAPKPAPPSKPKPAPAKPPQATPAPSPEAPAPSTPATPKPAPSVPEPTFTLPSVGPEESAAPAPAQPSTTAQPAAEDAPDSSNAALQGALYSGLAAAGLVGLLGLKRMIQQRRRKPGQQIRMPERMSDVEWDIRTRQRPDDANALAQALKTLAFSIGEVGDLALPQLDHVRVTGSAIEVTLAEAPPATLPTAPFQVIDPTTWRFELSRLLPSADVQDVPAPFPALLPIGTTDRTSILIDLERTGVIALTGDRFDATAVLTAMAIELATSSCADHIDVLCVGFVPDLPSALSTGRLRYADSLNDVLVDIQAHVRETEQTLHDAGLSHTRHARSTQTAESTWAPLIVLSAQPVDFGRYGLLQSLSQGRGSFGAVLHVQDAEAVTNGALVFDSTPGRTVHVAGAEVVLQRITPPVYGQLLDDFTIASNTNGIVTGDWHDVPPEPDDLRALMVTEKPDEPARPPLRLIPAPALTEKPPVAPPAPPHVPAEQPVPQSSSAEIMQDLAALSPLLADGPVLQQPPVDPKAPFIRVLGRVQIDGRDVMDLAAGKRSLLVELAAYLKLGNSPNAEEVSKALGGSRGPWSSSTRSTNMSRLRGWFSTDVNGDSYIPLQSGDRLYTVSDAVRCDWELFQEHAGIGLRAQSLGREQEAISALRQALSLVRGQPFSSAGIDRYIWAEHLKQEMISKIVDVAHALAEELVQDGNFLEARAVIAQGLDIEPGSELLYRDLFRAEFRAGNRAGLNDAAERLLRSLHNLGLEMEPETADLLDRLLNDPFRNKAL